MAELEKDVVASVEFGRQIEEQKVQMMQMQVQAVQAAQATPRDLVMRSLFNSVMYVMSHVIPSFLWSGTSASAGAGGDRVEESINPERSISLFLGHPDHSHSS